MKEIAEMESSKAQDFRSIRTSKHKSHKVCKLNNNMEELAAFLRRCHMGESVAGTEKKIEKEKSKIKYTMVHLG